MTKPQELWGLLISGCEFQDQHPIHSDTLCEIANGASLPLNYRN